MSASPHDLASTPNNDVLRMRIRVRPGELLFRPLQNCRSSAERTRLLLSLAIKGYLLDPGPGRSQPLGPGGCVVDPLESGTGRHPIRGELVEETRSGTRDLSAATGFTPAGSGSPESASEDFLDGLSFATVFKRSPE